MKLGVLYGENAIKVLTEEFIIVKYDFV